MIEEISNEELQSWRVSRGTREMVHQLRNARLAVMENWAAGFYTAETADATVQKNAEAIGRISEIDGLLQAIEEAGEEDEQPSD